MRFERPESRSAPTPPRPNCLIGVRRSRKHSGRAIWRIPARRVEEGKALRPDYDRVSFLLSVTFACGLFIAVAHVMNRRFVAPVYDVAANLTAFGCAVAASSLLGHPFPRCSPPSPSCAGSSSRGGRSSIAADVGRMTRPKRARRAIEPLTDKRHICRSALLPAPSEPALAGPPPLAVLVSNQAIVADRISSPGE